MIKVQNVENTGELFEKFRQLHGEYGHYWLQETFLHWDWWISALLSGGAWVIWYRYRTKESTHRLLYAGVFVILISLVLDYIGVAIGLWHYNGKLTPSFPAWLPFNFCMLPVAVMLLIQFKPHIAAWKKGLFFGAITAYVGEPIFAWAGFYILTGWKFTYSLPIYALVFIFADWLVKRRSFSEACCK